MRRKRKINAILDRRQNSPLPENKTLPAFLLNAYLAVYLPVVEAWEWRTLILATSSNASHFQSEENPAFLFTLEFNEIIHELLKKRKTIYYFMAEVVFIKETTF